MDHIKIEIGRMNCRWSMQSSIFTRAYTVSYQVNGPKRSGLVAFSFIPRRSVQRTLCTSHLVSPRLIGVVTFSDLIYARETLSPDVGFLPRWTLSNGIQPDPTSGSQIFEPFKFSTSQTSKFQKFSNFLSIRQKKCVIWNFHFPSFKILLFPRF